MQALHERTSLTRARVSSLLNRGPARLLVSRFIVNVGNACGTSLLLFFLLYGIGVPSATAEDKLLVLVIYQGLVGHRLLEFHRRDDLSSSGNPTVVDGDDHPDPGFIGRHHPHQSELSGDRGRGRLMGTGYGAYMAVSLAFATDLLLDPEDHARDLSLVNSAANLGQLVGPLLGTGSVALVGGFWLLFASAAVVSVVGALLTLTVRPKQSVLRDPAPE